MPNWKQTFVDLVEDINPMWRAEMERNGEWEEMKEYAVELATERWEFERNTSGCQRKGDGKRDRDLLRARRPHSTTLLPLEPVAATKHEGAVCGG